MGETNQPDGKPQMSVGGLAKDMGSEYLKGAAKEGGKQTVEYTQTEEGEQQIQDAKAQAEGLWAKYCGCFASAA